MMGVGDGSGISWTICKQSAPLSRQITNSGKALKAQTDRQRDVNNVIINYHREAARPCRLLEYRTIARKKIQTKM